jgi:hypothetical protein
VLLREALDVVRATDFAYTRFEILRALRDLLSRRGREDEVAAVEEELAEFPDVTWGQPEAASTARIA